MDTGLSEVLVFKLFRTEAATPTVPPPPIVITFDIIKHRWRAIPAVCSEYGADTLPDRYRSDGRCLLFRQQAGISALKQELEVKTPYRAMNHPVIGVVTKADLASMEQISLVKSWLREAGAHNVLVTSAVNNNGVTELFALLHTEEGCC